MIKHILFDLDDTLYAGNAGLMHEISQRMNEFMVTFLGVSESEVTFVRKDYWERYGTTLRGLYLERHIDAQAFLNFVHDVPVEQYVRQDDRLDAMLKAMSQSKHIFTNAPASHARRVLAALGIDGHFTRVFDINFIGYESKPAPAGYQQVLDALGARGVECLMIDDSARNLAPAKDLGMRTVFLDWKGSGTVPVEADESVASIYDLAKLLESEG